MLSRCFLSNGTFVLCRTAVDFKKTPLRIVYKYMHLSCLLLCHFLSLSRLWPPRIWSRSRNIMVYFILLLLPRFFIHTFSYYIHFPLSCVTFSRSYLFFILFLRSFFCLPFLIYHQSYVYFISYTCNVPRYPQRNVCKCSSPTYIVNTRCVSSIYMQYFTSVQHTFIIYNA